MADKKSKWVQYKTWKTYKLGDVMGFEKNRERRDDIRVESLVSESSRVRTIDKKFFVFYEKMLSNRFHIYLLT